jgi:steroid delta-isomerase-like uncharacterized protein
VKKEEAMSEQNKAVMKRWFEAFNQGRDAALAILDEVVTTDYVMRDPSGDLNGREALRQFVGMMFDGMPDFRMSLDDMIVEGDRLAYQFTIRGTHTAELMGFAPTGRQVQVGVTSIARFKDGKLAEETQTWDFHGFLQQLSPGEGNKVLARHFFEEVLNKRDLTAAEKICGANAVFHAWHWPELRGISGMRDFLGGMAAGSSDFQYSIDEMIGEGDQVEVRWTFKGTHDGEFLGVKATGKVVTVAGTSALKIVAGKIIEQTGRWDALGMLQQVSETIAKTVQVTSTPKAESAG